MTPTGSPMTRHLHPVPTDHRRELAGMVTQLQQDEARDLWVLLGRYANSHPALFIDRAIADLAVFEAAGPGVA